MTFSVVAPQPLNERVQWKGQNKWDTGYSLV
jgi:hypothetical protein